MKREDFRKLLEKRILVLDGATGTNLMDAGLPLGVCPEQWILEHPEALIDLQVRFLEAGTSIVYAPTFTCNRIKLKEYHLEDKTVEMNRRLVELSKEAVRRCNQRGYVAGDMTMTGRQLYPIGDLQFEDLVDVYKEQAQALLDAGVDLIVVETMMSLQESRAALIAIREISEDIPVMVSLTFNEDGKTMFGSTPEVSVIVLQGLGADAVGLNCSTGPEEMSSLVEGMKRYATIPVFAKPNAGMPELEDGVSVYKMTPEHFSECIRTLVDAGANLVGGCCGSNPSHIKAVKQAVRNLEPMPPREKSGRVLTSERALQEIDLNGPFLVVGERINPTGKKKLQASLREGSLDLVSEMAISQEENHAHVLDINMGLNGIDEKEMMLRAINEVTQLVSLPLCIDSSHVDIIEAALRIYPGRALINSVSLESQKTRPLFKIAKKYGAMCILLPVSDDGLPANAEERRANVDQLVKIALEEGLTMEDLCVDGLVSTVGADPNAALNTLDTIRYSHDVLGLPTICGLSNISFGLPERINVNSAFLTMAISAGLTMAIANPGQEQLMNAAYASDLLLAKEGADKTYVEYVRPITGSAPGPNAGAAGGQGAVAAKPTSKTDEPSRGPVFDSVINGSKGKIVDEVKKAMEAGRKPKEIIDEDLIPAITRVGELFEEKRFFLPQLIQGANAMDAAIQYLVPFLPKAEGTKSKGTVVFASVEGDVHEIGKNLCVLMLRNYGYTVIDLGKDVPAADILAAAKEHKADIIGLSALMTTTMMKMKEVVELAKAEKCTAKIIIGGAVISQSFADEIHADGYSKDANECVKVVDRLLDIANNN
ncbi:MAG: homocysteine S-methyltransferase family protein [Eubacterium sp.]|nr:homocysteine S-methyltransferase family protein [Eubacterium sp.]